VHENCWYIAIWGYGIGFIVLCSILYVSKL
jgi:hypothetical protein